MQDHPEEQYKTFYVISYAGNHPSSVYRIEWSGVDSYEGTYDGAWNSDNSGDFDINDGDSRYDEFEQCSFRITRVIHDGVHRYSNSVTIDYRDFPDRIVDISSGVLVFPNEYTPQ